VDYLDIDGSMMPSVGGNAPPFWFYKRIWQVTLPSANLKQLSVTAIVRTQVGVIGRLPRATVITLKTSPF
jgi:hypothetical protein